MCHESLLNGLWPVERANAVSSRAVVCVVGVMKEVFMRRNSLRLTLVAALATAALSACVVAPGPGYGYYGETVVEAPPGYVWIGGSWYWEGGRYAWHPGYWSAPRPGYHWAPRTWERTGGGWRAREGHWERGEGHGERGERHWDRDR